MEKMDIYTLLLNDYNKAVEVIKKAPRLGEIGGLLRSKGYYVHYDGFSSCTFRSKIAVYYAHCYDDRWKLSTRITVYDDAENEYKFDITNSAKMPNITSLQTQYSPKEKFELGLIKAERWNVSRESGREIFSSDFFDTFEEAKEFAYNMAKENYERIKSRRDDTSCYAKLAELSDKHRSVLAYEYYNYQGHCSWVEVNPIYYRD